MVSFLSLYFLQTAALKMNSSHLFLPSPPLWTISWRFPTGSSLITSVLQWLGSMACEYNTWTPKHLYIDQQTVLCSAPCKSPAWHLSLEFASREPHMLISSSSGFLNMFELFSLDFSCLLSFIFCPVPAHLHKTDLFIGPLRQDFRSLVPPLTVYFRPDTSLVLNFPCS